MTKIGKDLALAKQLLQSGELVAIPTETVYGLAANGLNPEAVARIFEAKNRPSFNPLILHVASVEQAKALTSDFPSKAQLLADTFWPGPLTIVLPRHPSVPDIATGGLDTVALRVPNDTADAVRIEHRVAGADANPYLLLSAVLAGVHHGLTNKIEPSAPVEGNSYEQNEQSLPNNLRDALRELDDSEVLARYIDPKYIDIFVACKESELAEFENSISDLEYNWYLHTV